MFSKNTIERNDTCQLVNVTYTTDSIGQKIPTETTSTVFCGVASVTANEFFQGGEKGLKPEYKLAVLEFEYEGQETVIYNSVRYTVYRTYRRNDELIELYCARRSGS